jgi:hypothetical protein
VNLFGRARKALGGASEPPAPQAYRVACPEGHILSGQRTEGYQALRCPACGEGVFILPRSPLPRPPAPVAQRTRRRRPVQTVAEGPIELMDAPAEVELAEPQVEVEIQWEDDVPAAPPPRPQPPPEEAPAEPARPAPRKGTAAARSAPSRPAARPPRPPAPRPQPAARVIEIPAERPGLRQRIYRKRHALAVLGLVTLIAGTVGVRILRRQFENLPKVASANRAEGLEALVAGEFDAAKRKLDTAAWALERLGDPDAAGVRQQASEAAVLADLANRTLEEILEDVATRDDGPSQFEALHRGRSIIVEARVQPGPDLDYRILAGARHGRIDLDGFALLEGKRPGDVVIFGARLESINLGDDNVWLVGLEPDSGVFLNSPEARKALVLLGWPPPDAPADDAPRRPPPDDEEAAP